MQTSWVGVVWKLVLAMGWMVVLLMALLFVRTQSGPTKQRLVDRLLLELSDPPSTPVQQKKVPEYWQHQP